MTWRGAWDVSRRNRNGHCVMSSDTPAGLRDALFRVCAVTSYGAHTARTGGRLRRDNIFAALAHRGHGIDRLDIPARPGVRSAFAGGWISLTRGLRERAGQADVVLLGDVFCLPMMPVLARIGTPVVVDVVDSPYRLIGSAPQSTLHQRATVAAQRAQLLLAMQCFLPMANGVTYISREDAEIDAVRVRRLPPSSVVSNGIDPALFDVPLTPPPDGYLAWLADWTYPPNRESFAWFVRDVSPRLPDEVIGRLRLFGVGDPRPARHENSDWDRACRLVQHAGFVDSLADVYQGARAVIAPVVRGAGLSNKVLEPLAAGRPVLTTTVGSRGLSCDLAQHIRTSPTAEALAHEVVDLLRAPASIDGIDAGRAAIRFLSWAAAGTAMESALLGAMRLTTRRARSGR